MLPRPDGARHTGSFEETGAAYESLTVWADLLGLLKSPTVVFGIAYNDPTVTAPDNLRYDAALVILETVFSWISSSAIMANDIGTTDQTDFVCALNMRTIIPDKTSREKIVMAITKLGYKATFKL